MKDMLWSWSTHVQRPETLYRSRNIRFRPEYREAFLKAMGLQNGMCVLEVGCGPGVLCQRLEDWLPDSVITGLDRDEAFIDYARVKTKETCHQCTFVTGDALKLPFPDNTFNACTSHTVIEHVPTAPFLEEQYRVCRGGGVVSVLSVRTDAGIKPEDPQPPSAEEQDLWKKAEAAWQEFDKAHSICAYPCSVRDIPRHMEKAGFQNVSVDFISVTTAPDNGQYDLQLRKEMIEENRQVSLDAVDVGQHCVPGAWSAQEVSRLQELINRRFDDRLKALQEGKRIWDISVSLLMVARGYKLLTSIE